MSLEKLKIEVLRFTDVSPEEIINSNVPDVRRKLMVGFNRLPEKYEEKIAKGMVMNCLREMGHDVEDPNDVPPRYLRPLRSS